MTKTQSHHRRQIAIAVASLTAGLFATGLAVYVEAVPHAFASEPLPVADNDAPTYSGTATVEPRAAFLPRIEGRAVSDVAEVNLAPMTVLGGHSSGHFAKSDFASKPGCVPYWRELESGPLGRHVLVTCPGARNVPPEPVSRLSNSGKLRLPTVAAFNGQLPRLQLHADLLPNASRARLASSAVGATLNRRWHAPRSGADRATRDVAQLPLQNPLSWAPTTSNAS